MDDQFEVYSTSVDPGCERNVGDDEFRRISRKAYAIVLQRLPSESEQDHRSATRRSEAFDPLDLVNELLHSEEFAERWQDKVSKGRSAQGSIGDGADPGAHLDAAMGHQAHGAQPRVPDGGDIRDFVGAAFEVILNRPADPDAEHHYVEEIKSGRFRCIDLVTILLMSAEFAAKILERPDVAERVATLVAPQETAPSAPVDVHAEAAPYPFAGHDSFTVARMVIRALMKREPEAAAVEAYGTSLAHGYAIDAFVTELVSSEEFRAKFAPPPTQLSRPSEHTMGIAQLSQELIVDALRARGGVVTGLPVATVETDNIDTDRLVAVLRTLAIMRAPRRTELVKAA